MKPVNNEQLEKPPPSACTTQDRIDLRSATRAVSEYMSAPTNMIREEGPHPLCTSHQNFAAERTYDGPEDIFSKKIVGDELFHSLEKVLQSSFIDKKHVPVGLGDRASRR